MNWSSQYGAAEYGNAEYGSQGVAGTLVISVADSVSVSEDLIVVRGGDLFCVDYVTVSESFSIFFPTLDINPIESITATEVITLQLDKFPLFVFDAIGVLDRPTPWTIYGPSTAIISLPRPFTPCPGLIDAFIITQSYIVDGGGVPAT